MNIPEIDYASYADLIIGVGINLQKDQNLIIRFHPSGIFLARSCAEAAYRRGAGLVHLEIKDSHFTKARVVAQAGNEKALSAVLPWTAALQNEILDNHWAYLALESYEDVGLLAETDQDALNFLMKSQTQSLKFFHDAITSHGIAWCLAAVPGPSWARRVLGENRDTEDLWELLKPILLLDRDDPQGAWWAKADDLVIRSKILDDFKLDALRFQDKGTDLTVGLLEASRWTGGPDLLSGRRFMSNLPTEEVFTTPDRRRCEGTVRVTRPVEVRGTLVQGASFTFQGGRVVDFDAEVGREALAAYLSTDSGASRLGELALVGADSPIAASGFQFNSILFDENAACHIALGAGYTFCLEGGEALRDDVGKEAAGCNASLVHTDFMIGSPTTTVTGLRRNGGEIPLLVDGSFVI